MHQLNPFYVLLLAILLGNSSEITSPPELTSISGSTLPFNGSDDQFYYYPVQLPHNFNGTIVDIEVNGSLPDMLATFQNSPESQVAVFEDGQVFFGNNVIIFNHHLDRHLDHQPDPSFDPQAIQDHTILWNSLLLIGYLLIVLISLPGNFLVCRIICSTKKLHTTTNILILSLTASDIATTILNIPFMCARTMMRDWPFPESICMLIPTLQVCSVYASTFTMAAIGIHRFRAVRVGRVTAGNGRSSATYSPYVMTKSKIIVWIIMIWAVSLMLALPHSMFNKVIDHSPSPYQDAEGHSRPARRCRAIYPEPYTEELPLVLSIETAITQFVVPLTITAILYTKIAIIIQRQGQLARHFCDELNRRVCEAKRKRIFMLIIVVGAFALSWAPLTIYHLLIDCHTVTFNYAIFMVLHQMAMLSVCYNPFIYCWMNEAFRIKAKKYLLLNKIFPCCCLAESSSRGNSRGTEEANNSLSARWSSFNRGKRSSGGSSGNESARMIKRICTFQFLSSCLPFCGNSASASFNQQPNAAQQPNHDGDDDGDDQRLGSSTGDVSAQQSPSQSQQQPETQLIAVTNLHNAINNGQAQSEGASSGTEANGHREMQQQQQPTANRFNLMVSNLVKRCTGGKSKPHGGAFSGAGECHRGRTIETTDGALVLKPLAKKSCKNCKRAEEAMKLKRMEVIG